MKKYESIIGFGLTFLISFIVYLITLHPTVSYTDSGELAAAAITLGVAHPTGYPLFIILSHLWSYLPISSSPIYELNIFAAFTTALSAAMIFLIILRINKIRLKSQVKNVQPETKQKSTKLKSNKQSKIQINNDNLTKEIIEPKDDNLTQSDDNEKLFGFGFFLAFAFALLYSFALTIWQQSTAFEVYSLQLFIFTFIIYCIIKAKFDDSKNDWYLLSLLVGLGFANHMTTLLIIPGIIFIYFKNIGKGFDFSNSNMKQTLLLLLPFLLGLSLYIYLPLRASGVPLLNWGWVHRGLDEFLFHVQGKQYQIWMFSGEKLGENMAKFFNLIPYQVSFPGLILLIIGFYQIFRKNYLFASFLIISLLSCFFYAVNYSIHDIDAYFSLSFITLIIISVFGFDFIIEKTNRKYVFLAFLLPIINLAVNFDEADQSDRYLVHDYTKNLVSGLDSNAIIISAQWDYWNSAFWYFQNVENYRKDVVLVEKELMRRTWYPLQFQKLNPELYENCRNQFELYKADLEKFEKGFAPATYPAIQNNFINLYKCLIESNIDKRPVYITLDILQTEPDIASGYLLKPVGMAIRLFKSKPEISNDKLLDNKQFDRFISLASKPKSYLDSGIVSVVSMNFLNLARYYENEGQTDYSKYYYKKALQVLPSNSTARIGLENLK